MALRHYVEKIATWQNPSVDTDNQWLEHDLTQYGVPPNVVAEIVVGNTTSLAPRLGGVRATSSSLSRYVDIKRKVTGESTITMHVQVDASGKIEYFAEDANHLNFNLMGYWVGCVYVENIQEFDPAGSFAWYNKTLAGYGVSNGDVADITLCNKFVANQRQLGVREVGSSRTQLFNISKSTGGGNNCLSTMVTAASPNATIQVYAQGTFFTRMFFLGHFSTPPGDLNETLQFFGAPTSDSVWEDLDVGASGVASDSVAHFTVNLGHAFNTIAGVRETTSTLDRRIDFSRPETTPVGDTYMAMQVNVDSSGHIERRAINLFTPENPGFHCLGYWTNFTNSTEPFFTSTATTLFVEGANPNIHYIENYTGNNLRPATMGSWQDVDVSSEDYPNNAVAEIVLQNKLYNNPILVGTREHGSTADRAFLVRDSGPTNSDTDVLTFHVNTHSSEQIEVIGSGAIPTIYDIYGVGYWIGSEYVEIPFITFNASAQSGWVNHDLLQYGVPSGKIAEIVVLNADESAPQSGGVRQVGSTIDRVIEMNGLISDQSSPTGFDALPMFVNTSGSNSTIQVYAGNSGLIDFAVIGYWNVAPGEFTELITTIDPPGTGNSFWHQVDLLNDYSIPEDATVHICMGNTASGIGNTLGVREIERTSQAASEARATPARYFNIRETVAPGSWGADVFTAHVNNTVGLVEFLNTFVDEAKIWALGYWDNFRLAVTPISGTSSLYIGGAEPSIQISTSGDLFISGRVSIDFSSDLFMHGHDIVRSHDNQMYWADIASINKSDLVGNNVSVVVPFASGLTATQSVDIDHINRKVYWSDAIAGGNGLVSRSDIDGQNVENGIVSGLDGVRGVAVDPFRNSLYWIERTGSLVGRADLDGSNSGILTTSGVSIPRRIDVDLNTGKVYWSDNDSGGKISRIDFDGTNQETLFTGISSSPFGIAVHHGLGKLYWGFSDQNTIEQSNLDGSNRETIVHSGLGFDIADEMTVDTIEDKLYWTDTSANKIYRIDLPNLPLPTTIEDVTPSSIVEIPQGVAIDLANVGVDLYIGGFVSASGTATLFISGLAAENLITASVDLYIVGHETVSKSADLFIHGKDISTASVDLYIYGKDNVNDSVTLFIKGHQNTTASTDLFIGGHVATSDSIDLFIAGKDDSATATDLYIRGRDSTSNSTTLFIGGQQGVATSIDLFIGGIESTFESSDLYIGGHISITGSISLFISGDADSDTGADLYIHGMDNVNSSADLFIAGHQSVSTSVDLYIQGHQSNNASSDLYIQGKEAVNNSSTLFIEGFEGSLTSVDLYIQGHQSINSSSNLYILGKETANNASTLFIAGRDSASTSVDLFIQGHDSTITSTSLFIEGSVDASGSQSPTLFIHGHDVVQKSSSLFIHGLAVISTSGDLFIEGSSQIITTSGDADLYIQGQKSINLASDLYIRGKESNSNSSTLFIEGQESVSTSGDLYLLGHNETSKSTTLFLGGQDSTSTSGDLFIHGFAPSIASSTLFILGSSPSTISSTLYIGGYAQINGSVGLVINGHLGESLSTTLYISGPESVFVSTSLFIRGSGIIPISGITTLFINGLEPKPSPACPILDPDAVIQIPSSLIKTYQGIVDGMVNQLGKNILLEFDPLVERCPNCEFDTLRHRSTGIYVIGGPRPFSRGRKCPYCKGRGLLETPVTQCIKCLTEWNPQDAKKYGISVEKPADTAKLKTYIVDADSLIRAKTAILDYDIASQMTLRTRLIKGPIPLGLREDRYCVSFWQLI